VTQSGEHSTTQKSKPATSTEPSKESAAQTANHQSDHTDAANASHAKGTAMASMYDIEQRLEKLEAAVASLMASNMGTILNTAILTGTPLDANRDVPDMQETIEEPITDPDA
jgi:hypothetical protein